MFYRCPAFPSQLVLFDGIRGFLEATVLMGVQNIYAMKNYFLFWFASILSISPPFAVYIVIPLPSISVLMLFSVLTFPIDIIATGFPVSSIYTSLRSISR
eukprot:snap_masked-scaffold_30-processed-gene-2.51-mRNA-1 protein AED:1.00 eAED:1.00 QI:0/0/0/0/1/1/2/0/99